MIMFTKLFQNLSPHFIKRLIDPGTYRINEFVISVVNEAKSGNLVLDAGAGECRYKSLLEDIRYVAIDAA